MGNLRSGIKKKKNLKIVLTHVVIYNKYYNLRTLREDNMNAGGCDQRELQPTSLFYYSPIFRRLSV